MNRLLTSVFFAILLQTFLIAQKYYSIDTLDVVWNELKEDAHEDIYHPFKFIETYIISGDTFINNLKFYKIYIKGSHDSSYVGCFREEDKKVYYIGIDYFGFETDSTVLLYDFNKQKNDTIHTGTWHHAVIDDIDSILIGNSYRKRFQMDDGQFWIEGIGSTCGFLYPMTAIPTMYWRSELICFKHNDSLLYLSPNYIDCNTEKQLSIEWAPVSATWYYSSPYGGKCIIIESIKDTIISLDTCRLLEIRYCDNDIPISYEIIKQRYDSIFYLNDNEFYLLYNFSSKVNDTITVHNSKFKLNPGFLFTHYNSIDKFQYRITEIDSLQISGIWIRRQHIENIYSTGSYWKISTDEYPYILNRIGSLCYFFGRFSGIIPEETSGQLRCYNDHLFTYQNPEWPYDCDKINTISTNFSQVKFSIYPNPSFDKFYFHLHNSNNDVVSLSIFEITGKMIMSVDTKDDIEFGNNFKSGFYIVKIRDKNTSALIKIIKAY